MVEEKDAALLPPERRSQIAELVRRNKSVLVKDLCVLFDVTGETIRKDLTVLAQEGQLIKTYGGAYVQGGVKNEIDESLRETLFPRLKDAIGAYCAGLVHSGDAVFLDESTTCLAIARHLLEHDNLTVVTNSLKIACAFADRGDAKLILSGGELDRKNQCFIGGGAEEFISSYYVDKSFVSCRGLDQTSGVTDGNAVNGRVRRLMLQRGGERFLVLDHTKLDMVHFFQICDFSLVNTVVIDTLTASWRAFFRRKGIRFVETASQD